MAEPSIAAIADLTEAFAEPFAAASALGMIAISGAVAEQATVLLTGDGGDDVFLGYPRHRHLYLAEQIARHLPLGAASQWPLFRAAIPPIGALRRARALGDYAMGGEPEVERAGSSLEFYRQSGILGPRLEAAPSPDGNGAARWSIGRGRSVLEDNLRHAYRTRFLAEYMTKVDGSTMHHGLEARAPFLDQELWTFVASLPPSVRLRGYRLKALLRALAEKRIGAATARRRKQGFGIPAARWLTGRWYEEARAFWPDSVAQREGWIRGDALMRRLAASRAAGAAPLELWYLLVLELWLRRETSTGHARRRTAASTA